MNSAKKLCDLFMATVRYTLALKYKSLMYGNNTLWYIFQDHLLFILMHFQ